MKTNNFLRGLKHLKPIIFKNTKEPPNTVTNFHNWVLGFRSKTNNSSPQQKKNSDEFLILGVLLVCLDSTSQVEAKSAHKGAKKYIYIVD
jgi:hypothetical protein